MLMSTLAPSFLTDALADFQCAERNLVQHASGRFDMRTGRIASGSCVYGCAVDPVQRHRAVAVSAFLTRPEHCVLHPHCGTAIELLAVLDRTKAAYDDARSACGIYTPSALRTLAPRIAVTLEVSDLPTESHVYVGSP